MKQLNMFEPANFEPFTEEHIPGLKYTPNYISNTQELELLNIIDAEPWITDLKRRVQYYGYKYDYKSRSIDHSYYLGPLPEWLMVICEQLYSEGIFRDLPDQVIVNEYMPGQGIAPHIDCEPCFGDTICSLSLASSCLMEFSKDDIKAYRLLEPRGLLILSG